MPDPIPFRSLTAAENDLIDRGFAASDADVPDPRDARIARLETAIEDMHAAAHRALTAGLGQADHVAALERVRAIGRDVLTGEGGDHGE